jgi:hypothetical protein
VIGVDEKKTDLLILNCFMVVLQIVAVEGMHSNAGNAD